MIKTHRFAFIAASLGIVVLAVYFSNEFIAQATTSKNSTISSTSNTTGALVNTTNVTQKQNNVTTAAGNNGHIYRGGAATGSGGE